MTASAEEAEEAMREGLGALLRKPYNLDEVLAHIDDLLARADRARNDAPEAQEIEGALAQLALPDLLQTLALARRTGRVTLRRGNERGEVELAEGRPVDARAGAVQGEKALFRLLDWAEGTFSFQPGPPPAETGAGRGTDELLLEAARQTDECRRLVAALPEAGTRWAQAPGAALRAVPPLAREVLGRLERPRSTAELLDGVEAAESRGPPDGGDAPRRGAHRPGGRGRATRAGAPAHGGGGPRGAAGARARGRRGFAGPGR